MSIQEQANKIPPSQTPLAEQYSVHNPKGIKPETLSGQQVQALQKQLADKMAGIVKDVDLRKWAVDQACSLAGSAMEFRHLSDNTEKPDVVKLARSIHAFLTEETSQTT
jgi:FKBP-type peptidyl-prolyl cis-trans isomerase 2